MASMAHTDDLCPIQTASFPGYRTITIYKPNQPSANADR